MALEDQIAGLYGMAKKQVDAAGQREAELQKATAALQAAIAQLQKLPEDLSSRTNQYIAAGIRQAIHADFQSPIASAVEVPLADFKRTIYEGRGVLQQLNRESRFHDAKWIAAIVLFSLLGGIGIDRISIASKLDNLSGRLAVVEQQTAPPAPALEAKPIEGKPAKEKKGR